MLSQASTEQTDLSRAIRERASYVLDAVEDGQTVEVTQALALLSLKSTSDCARLQRVSDALRTRQAGHGIAYDTGQSLFLTNICEMTPALYPYPAPSGSPQAHGTSIDTIDAILQATKSGQSCWLTVSGGGFHSQLVIPGLEAPTVLKTYLRVLSHIQDQLPSCRVRGFSPDEIAFLAVVSNRSEAYILDCLRDHGLEVLAGFGVEILDDTHRARIAPKKLTVKRWLEIVAMAHQRGLPTIARLEAGPLESLEQRLAHLAVLRAFQDIHPGAFQRLTLQMWPHPPHLPIAGPQAGLISELDVLKLVAVARLLLGSHIPQIQLSWFPERLDLSQQAFEWGASHAGSTDDLAYAHFLRGLPPAPVWTEAELRSLIQEAGQSPQ
jgi:2-iminoacetate synthase ThiH